MDLKQPDMSYPRNPANPRRRYLSSYWRLTVILAIILLIAIGLYVLAANL